MTSDAESVNSKCIKSSARPVPFEPVKKSCHIDNLCSLVTADDPATVTLDVLRLDFLDGSFISPLQSTTAADYHNPNSPSCYDDLLYFLHSLVWPPQLDGYRTR